MSLLLGISMLQAAEGASALTLPAIFGSNMVLQREARTPVWGKTAPGRLVKVTLKGQTKSTTANSAGDWQVAFRNLPAGDGGEMTVTDGVDTKTFGNILIGDVWICSGQSNMEWGLADTQNAQKEVAAAQYDQIRLFQVQHNAAVGWKGDIVGKWELCSPKTAAPFSAVGYFFGRSLYLSERAPVGLINSSWGGTVAEAWTPKETLLSSPATKELWDRYEAGYELLKKQDPELIKLAGQASGRVDDPGNKGLAEGWAKPDFDTSGWDLAKMPALFEAVPKLQINGIVWFRKVIDVPASAAGKSATLSLGPIDDYDITYLNGEEIGRIDDSVPNAWSTPRVYQIPAGKLKAGRNVIAVRIHDSGGAGGFSGGADDMVLDVSGSKIKLAGDWAFKIEFGVRAIPGGLQTPNNPNSPTALFDGQIKPLTPYGIKGAIWYQGESNAGRAQQYSVLFPNMIRSWRQAFQQGEFPFLFVQLANYMAKNPNPGDSSWAELREAQEAALKLTNTGSAVIIDIGEANDIHPRNKKDVGERLAMSARTFAFKGKPEPAGNSPRMEKWRTRGAEAIVTFTNAKGLMTSDGKPPVGFAVKGEDNVWRWANAKIVDSSVVLSNPDVKTVTAVRYAWADNPDTNLYNGQKLPVCPFRTDKPY